MLAPLWQWLFVKENISDTATYDPCPLKFESFISQNGFMPSEPPLTRLPAPYNVWEECLDAARSLVLGDDPELEAVDRTASETWRFRVREVRRFSVQPFARNCGQLTWRLRCPYCP